MDSDAEITRRLNKVMGGEVWGEKYRIMFGKYKGRTLGTIAEIEPGYIVWLKDTAEKPIAQELYDECRRMKEDIDEFYDVHDIENFGDR